MKVNQKLKLCIISNLYLLIIIIVVIAMFSSNNDKYWNYGPSPNLVIMSVEINTWNKY